MSNKKKLKLEDLIVDSFITNIGNRKKNIQTGKPKADGIPTIAATDDDICMSTDFLCFVSDIGCTYKCEPIRVTAGCYNDSSILCTANYCFSTDICGSTDIYCVPRTKGHRSR